MTNPRVYRAGEEKRSEAKGVKRKGGGGGHVIEYI